MELLSLAKLQPVLKMAQKCIGRIQLMEIVARNVALIVQLLQREKRASGTQPGLRAAVNTLQALHQKLDISNAAAIDFYIDGVVLCCVSLTPALMVNLFSSDERGLDGSKIDLVTVNLRLDTANEFAGKFLVTRRVAYLDERLPLPVVGNLRVIIESAGQVYRQLAFISLRPQPQIDPEDHAFGGWPRENFRHLLREAHEIFTIRNAG